MKKVFIILMIFNIIFTQKVKAENINDYINKMDFSEIQNKSDQIDFKKLVMQIVNGELDISPKVIINEFLKALFNELYENAYLIKNLIVISIFSGILKALSFEKKEVGELGFYICYVVLIIILFNSFKIAVDIMINLVVKVSDIMEACIPLVMSLLMMSGYKSSASIFSPFLFVAVNIITMLIKNIIAPVIIFISVIQILNYLSVKEIFSKLTIQLRDCISFVIKGTSIIFIAILSMQRISAPIMDNLIARTAKVSINAIPVVGEVLSGAVDTVIYWVSATKGGVLLGLLVIIIFVSFIPIIKIIALIMVYKLIASFMQPICDDRIIECIDQIGNLTVTVLSCVFMIIVMFIFFIMIILSF